MPAGVSALPQTSGTTAREMAYAAWDPQLRVPVIESLVYTEEGGSAVLNRQIQPNMAGTSGGTGVQSVAIFGYNGTNYYVPEVGTDRLLGVNVVSGGAGGGIVTQSDADNLHVSAVQGDAGLLHVSAIGGTAGDNVLVDGSDQSVSATLLQVSANVSSNADALLTRSVNEDAADLRISAIGGTAGDNVMVDGADQTISASLGADGLLRTNTVSGDTSATLKGGTAFIGNVSATIKNYPLNVSGTVSAFINQGSVSAKSNDADQVRVSTFSDDAGTMRISAVGGTAGDNVLVDGSDQSISAKLIQTSAAVSSSDNTLLTRATSFDASDARVSAIQGGSWTLSAFINEGSVSAVQPDANSLHVSSVQGDAGLLHVSAIGGTAGDNVMVDGLDQTVSALILSSRTVDFSGLNVSASEQLAVRIGTEDAGEARISAFQATDPWIVSGTIDVERAGTWEISALAKEGTAFLGNISATIKNYPLNVSGTVSSFINQGSVSAKSNDADQLRVSALSKDAGLARVSAIGGTAGDNVIVDGTDQAISAKLIQVSAAVSSNDNTFLTRATSYDAADLHTSAYQGGSWTLSAFINEGSVSAIQPDASNLMVSTKSDDAALMRVSAIGGTAGDNVLVDGTTQSISAKLIQVSAAVSSNADALITYVQNREDASDVRVSSFVDSGSVSAKQGTDPWIVSGTIDSEQAGTWAISALGKEGTAFLGNVSATVKNYPLNVSGTVSTFINEGSVSAIQPDADSSRVSAFSDDGTTMRLSALQTDADNLHVSADLMAHTTGSLTVFRTLNVSASQAAKAAAGSVYGYYAWNSDTIYNYIRLYNTSGAINVGTDTPIVTIAIPPSAAANMEYPHGLVGFTNGIGIAGTSAVADNSTTATAASAVGINLFYK